MTQHLCSTYWELFFPLNSPAPCEQRKCCLYRIWSHSSLGQCDFDASQLFPLSLAIPHQAHSCEAAEGERGGEQVRLRRWSRDNESSGEAGVLGQTCSSPWPFIVWLSAFLFTAILQEIHKDIQRFENTLFFTVSFQLTIQNIKQLQTGG